MVAKKKGQCRLPSKKPQLYTEPLVISALKFKDVQSLKQFCGPAAQAFYNDLKSDATIVDEIQESVDIE